MTNYIVRYQYKDGEGGVRDTYLADNNITTYLIEGRVEVSGDFSDDNSGEFYDVAHMAHHVGDKE